MSTDFTYQTGFGNEFASEALEGALPEGQNSPQKVNHGLYAEQLSGTSFTTPRKDNQRSWLYRIRPSAKHQSFQKNIHNLLKSAPFDEANATPNRLRWNPLPHPEKEIDFIDGLVTLGGSKGYAVHLYAANKSMNKKAFYNADGEFLIVPQTGTLLIKTEFGVLDITPGEIAVIQRGIKFSVSLPENKARGYVCENYGKSFQLPELGPLGANGLAYPRDFLTPVAAYENLEEPYELVTKFQGSLWNTNLEHSPFDVVAWHGNYAPYKYDLKKFQAVNSVSFDHSDPSIFTVLTSPSSDVGVANLDFVIFPERWNVAENTFRPPYYHRNFMSEFMGLIYGEYDAKQEGFLPGGASLHNCMSAHGPDANTFNKASSAELKPVQYKNTLAFMFESRHICTPTQWALETDLLQKNYDQCWEGLKSHFTF